MTRKILVLGLSVLPTLALGMEHAPDSVHHLSQVEVLGKHIKKPAKKSLGLSRTDVSLDKLPMTINTIDMKDLAMRGLYQPMEALRFSSGTGIRQTYGAFLQLSIRGFDYAPVVVDGMRDERTTFNSYPLSDLSDVESIEILKGPASVLQGHSAVGGTMNITRRKAIQQTNISAYLSYGSFDSKRAMVSAGGYLGQGWSILSGVAYAGGEGWRSRGDRNFKAYTTASKVWNNNTLDLRLSYHNDFYGTEAGLPAVFTTPIYDSRTNEEYLKPGQLQPKIRRDARYNNESDEMYHRSLYFTANWTSQLTDWLKLREQFSLSHDDIDYFSTEELSYLTSTKLNADGSAPYAHYYMSKDKDGKEVKTFVDLSRVQLTSPLRFRHMAKTAQNQLSLEAKFQTYGFAHNLNAGYALSFMDRVSFTGYQFGPKADTQDVTGAGLNSIISAYDPISAGPMQSRFSKANPMKVLSHGFFVQDVVEFSPMLQAMLAMRYDLYSYTTWHACRQQRWRHSLHRAREV
ncbi:MAG: TonB-dependent receptor [Porphyromonadaceae bacterium]|nr:TonB-dependent receptor [Porphyromonadaceae bacterium]